MIQNVSILFIIFFSLAMNSTAQAGFLIKEGYHDVIFHNPEATVGIVVAGKEAQFPIGMTIRYELTTKSLHTHETTTVTIPSLTLHGIAEKLKKDGQEILTIKRI